MSASVSFINAGSDEDARRNQVIVDDLRHDMRDMAGVERFPSNFKWLLQNRVWEKPRQFDTGIIFPPCGLCELITRPYPEGLEVSLETVERLISGRPDVLALWTEATKRKPGAPIGNQNAAIGKAETNVDIVNDCIDRPAGNSAAAGLRRLQKEAASEDEDKATVAKMQLDEVLAGRKSVHAACVDIGARKSTRIDADVKDRCFKSIAEWCVSHAGPDDDLSPLIANLFACGAKGIAIEIKNLTGAH